MNYQSTEYNCGPASLQNALEVLGRRVSQAKIAKLAGTDPDEGTDELGLQRAALALGLGVDPFAVASDLSAFAWVWNSIQFGRPVLLCVDRWEHWVAVIGICGKRLVVFDPARTKPNKDRNGLTVMTRQKLLKRWYAAKRTRKNDAPYYGIAISK